MSFWADVLAHTAFFMILLPAFFFGYVSPVQLDQVVENLFEILKPDLATFAMGSSLNDTNELMNVIQTISANTPDIPELDDVTSKFQADNQKVLLGVGLAFGLGSALFLGLAIFLEWNSGGSLSDLFLSNLIVITFIAISEFAIVGLFLQNFTMLDATFLKALFISQTTRNYGILNNWNCWYVSDLMKDLLPDWLYQLVEGHSKEGNDEIG